MTRRVSKSGRTNARRFETLCIALLFWVGAGGAPVLAAESVGGVPAEDDPATVAPGPASDAPRLPGRLYDVGLGYSVTRNSNITGGSIAPGCVSPPCTENTTQLFGGFAYQERNASLDARLVAQAEKRQFVRNAYRDDTGFFFDGAAVWTISPQLLTWAVEDSFREVPLDLNNPDTPANRSKANSFNTGPEFTFRVSSTNLPVIGIRYGRYVIQDTPSNFQGLGDNERYTTYARWLRQISKLAASSLNFETTRAYFDPPAPYTSLSREDLFLRYELLLPYNRQIVDVGATRVQFNGPEVSRPLVRYFGQLSPSAESALRVSYYNLISDTFSDMIRSVASLTIPTIPTTPADAAAFSAGSNTAASDIYRKEGGELIYVDLSRLSGYSLQGYVRRIDYLIDNVTGPQDYQEKGGRVSATLLFSLETQAYAFAQYQKRTFSTSDVQQADRDTGLGASHKVGRNLTLTVEAGQTERRQSTATETAVNRRAMFLLGYSSGALYSARPRR
jgi:hypothetical protein